MKSLNPDTLLLTSGEDMQERQARTGEVGNGKVVWCRPDLTDPQLIRQASRSLCMATPYAACLSCLHHRFEIFFEAPENGWVQCPRWTGESTGPPAYYAPIWLSECHAKPFSFCPQCPSRSELVQLNTDKQKAGWLERYWKMTRDEEVEEDEDDDEG